MALGLAACGGNDDIIKTIEFTATSAPVTDAAKRLVTTSPSVKVNGKDYPLSYNVLMRSGDVIGSSTWGQIYDVNGNVIMNTDGSPFVSVSVDHNFFMKSGGKDFLLSQFEDAVGVYYLTELKQDSATGKFTAVNTKPLNTSDVGGTWTHCAGSDTPWGTALGSEEYEPNAAKAGTADTMAPYFGGDKTRVNPYNYGFITETALSGADMGTGKFAANAKLVKHYSMGRLAFELGYVMPNQKTVYMSDDGSYVGFFRYEADKAGSLTSGKLYAAKLTQKSDTNGGSFDLSWVDLGSATDAEVKTMIDSKPVFTDIFDVGSATACAADHKLITTTAGTECLMVKPGKEKMASRLETRRYAAMLGATTELNKEEGITFDAASNRLFVAMSFVEGGMDKSKTAVTGVNDDIKLTKNSCGTVFALDLDTNYVAKNMYGLISGKETTYAAGTDYAGNTCDINGIANPDNVTFVPGYNTLIIGEDTGTGHQNDALWSYNLETKALTRILTTPYGAETTSPYVNTNINGFGYMTTVVQHPYGESDTDKAPAGDAARRAYVGYIGPFPRLD
jgi:hypothetical protein